jgi:hypothetical protein
MERDGLQSQRVCLDSLPAPQLMIIARRSLTMTIIITAFERSPDGGKDWRVIRAFAGHLKKWANPTRFALFRSVR